MTDIPALPSRGYAPSPDAFAGRLYVLANIGAGAGSALAIRLARYGARTVLTDPSPEVLESVDDAVRRHGGVPPLLQALDPLGATVADYEAVAEAVARTCPVLDGLVHDCGYVGYHGPLLTCPPEEWWAVLRTHLDAAFALTKAFLPALLASPRAAVIYTVTQEGRAPRAFGGAHAVAHAGLETLAWIANDEFAHRGRPRFFTLDTADAGTALRKGFFPEGPGNESPPPELLADAYLELLERGADTTACRALPRPPA